MSSLKVLAGLDVFEEYGYWKKLSGYRIGISRIRLL